MVPPRTPLVELVTLPWTPKLDPDGSRMWCSHTMTRACRACPGLRCPNYGHLTHVTHGGMGVGGGGHWLVRMEWRPAGWSVCLPLLTFPCTIKSRSSLLAPAHPGGPGKRAVKRLCVCVLLLSLLSYTVFTGSNYTSNTTSCHLQRVLKTTQPSYLHNLVSVQPPKRSLFICCNSVSSTYIILEVNDHSFQYASLCLCNQLHASLHEPHFSLCLSFD